MREYCKGLIKSGVIKVDFTSDSKYPLIRYREKLMCETELEKYGFASIYEFIEWYYSNF